MEEQRIVGKRRTMSFVNYTVAELWRSFLPRRNEIANTVTHDLISAAVYPHPHIADLASTDEFERWAGVEVTGTDAVPDGMEILTLPRGEYAVFHYKGLSTDTSVFQYIFGTWLPQSGYVEDRRPHFEILGERYKNNDPDSEEEIWIPVCKN
ncbi:MAG: GyrI-like domain-containing protein [Candidatus Kapabacteria bacterium]|nr:GyrI-like domain-containing protein [Candidatus Kapabacteria bacterium]